MTFDEKKTEYLAFRLKVAKTLLSALPSDPAAVINERAVIEGWFFESLELQADLESFYYRAKIAHHETALKADYPKSKCLDLAKAMSHEEKRMFDRAFACTEAIRSRNIKLSQSYKLRES